MAVSPGFRRALNEALLATCSGGWRPKLLETSRETSTFPPISCAIRGSNPVHGQQGMGGCLFCSCLPLGCTKPYVNNHKPSCLSPLANVHRGAGNRNVGDREARLRAHMSNPHADSAGPPPVSGMFNSFTVVMSPHLLSIMNPLLLGVKGKPPQFLLS